MTDEPDKVQSTDKKPYRVRLPGFVPDAEIGLGDAVKKMASVFGVTPCGGCDKRATALNRLMVFAGRRR